MATLSALGVEQRVTCAGFRVSFGGDGRVTSTSLMRAWNQMSAWLGVATSSISGGPDQYEVDDATYAAYRARFGDGLSRCVSRSGGSGAGVAIAAVAVLGTLYFVSKGKGAGFGAWKASAGVKQRRLKHLEKMFRAHRAGKIDGARLQAEVWGLQHDGATRGEINAIRQKLNYYPPSGASRSKMWDEED